MDNTKDMATQNPLEVEPNASDCERMWHEIVESAQQLPAKDTLGKLAILIPGLVQSQVIWRNIPLGSKPGGQSYKGHPFDLDGQRSAIEILQQGCGGSCGSYGKVLADALVKSGTDASRVFLVDTVGEGERHAAFMAVQTGDRASVCGHQFLLVEDMQDSWHLVNTTAQVLEKIPSISARELQKRINDSEYANDPVRVLPASKSANGGCSFPSLTDGPPQRIFGDLVVFSVHQSIDYPSHDINQRIRDVARVVPK